MNAYFHALLLPKIYFNVKTFMLEELKINLSKIRNCHLIFYYKVYGKLFIFLKLLQQELITKKEQKFVTFFVNMTKLVLTYEI